MNRFLPADAPKVATVPPVTPLGSAPAMVYALLVNSARDPLGIEDWLGELTKALGARRAALLAFLDNEPVVQYFFPGETEFSPAGSWPWQCDFRALALLAKDGPAVPTQSADGLSSFLTLAVEREGLLWVLSVEEAINRSWSIEDQAALTLAALGVFQFPSLQESARRWAHWFDIARTQQRLEDAAVVVGRLAHDFNNVLTSVLGFTELSLAHLSPGGAQRKLMAEVFAAAQQGSQLTNQLSLFSTRRTASQDSTTFLSFLLGTEAKRWREAWGNAVTLEVRVPVDLPALAIDADSLRIILDRVADNARAAIAGTGSITLSARPVDLSLEHCLGLLGKTHPGPYVELTVADSGCGFTPEARRRIFAEPFFSTKPRHRGLGLAAIYGVLMNSAGGIRLGHGVENGTQVHIYLPTAGPAEPFAQAASASHARGFKRDGSSPHPLPAQEKQAGIYTQASS